MVLHEEIGARDHPLEQPSSRGSRRLIAAERLSRLITANAGATPRRVPPIARVKSPIPGGLTF
jgi:hypothetical protein